MTLVELKSGKLIDISEELLREHEGDTGRLLAYLEEQEGEK